MKDLISIIVPVYNVFPYLTSCIESILAQTYSSIEVILVDDGSNDGSENICDRYDEKFENITVIHKENGGLSSARNAGIKKAKGSLIGFIDSDDTIEPFMYQTLYENMIHHNADISICGYWYGTKDCSILSHTINHVYNSYDAIKELLMDDIISNYAWNKLYRRELFSEIQFPEGKIYEDVRIMHKIFMSASTIVTCDKHCYHYLIRGDSIIGKQKASLEVIDAFQLQTSEILLKYPEFSGLAALTMFRKYKSLYFEVKANKNNKLLSICYFGIKKEWLKIKNSKEISKTEKLKCYLIRCFPNLIYYIKRKGESI